MNKFRQLGQGMTEYIIIVALIAVAAIGVYSYFGDTVKSQTAGLAAELSGGSAVSAQADAAAAADSADAASAHTTLGTYGGQQ